MVRKNEWETILAKKMEKRSEKAVKITRAYKGNEKEKEELECVKAV